MPHLKITQKGMLIVSVPLIFQSMFILLLFVLLAQINEQIKREEHARAVLSAAHHFGRMAVNASTAIASLGFAIDSEKAQKSADDHIKLCEEDVAQMMKLTQADPPARLRVDALKKGLETGKRLLANKRSQELQVVSRLDAIYNDPLVQESAECGAQLNNSVQDLVALEQDRASQSLAAVERSKQAIEFLLVGGVVASVLLTVSLMIFFSRNIVQRLQALSANASALGRRQPLSEPVSGFDEIAELDAALRRTDSELSQLEKARQNLIAFVSHELKTPLTSLSAFFSLLSDNAFMELDDAAGQVTYRAKTRIDDISRLIVDLIDVEKMQGGKFTLLLSDVDIPTVIDLATEKYLESHKAPLSFDLGEIADVVITADRDRLIRVLLNLFRNADSRNSLPGTIHIEALEKGDWIEFVLTDRGQEFPESLKASIFGSNQLTGDASALNVFLSDGLPLVISRMIIEHHGGSFEILSAELGGTKFVFRIPSDANTELAPVEPQEPFVSD